MKSNSHGQVILSTDELFEALYTGKLSDVWHVDIDDSESVLKFNSSIIENADDINLMSEYIEFIGSTEEFDTIHKNKWLMPDEFKQFRMAEWLVSQCKTTQELDRVHNELELFIQYDMLMLLNQLKYIVDVMRKNDIVWGVGRGSSVSSYCLYLIGVHKIDSLKFQLDIKEFLK